MFSYCSLFPNHLFTSTGSFLSCKFLHNPLLCCFIDLYKPLASFARWQLECHGCCMLGITAPGVTLLCCTLGNLVSSFILGVGKASPDFLHRALQHQLKSLVCLSVLELSESLPGILFSFLLPSSRAVDDLSFSVFLLIHSLSY